MRIPDFKITDEKTKAALVGYATLLTKDQSRVVSARLAEVNEALEHGDVDMARKQGRGAAMALMAILKTIGDSADLLGIEDPSMSEDTVLKASSDSGSLRKFAR
jgi:hypothetical protein